LGRSGPLRGRLDGDSFHGRTLAALAATGQAAKTPGSSPCRLVFPAVPFDDLEAMAKALEGV